MSDHLVTDPLWYKDAVIYELHVRAFADSNNDGMGDFRGLTARLDYLQDLGVNAIWLLPFYPSPWRDDGYDISDYRNIHPSYGSMRDFKAFLKAAHARGLRVITELVINHTSIQHPWFERARNARPGTSHRDYYVWSDTPDRYTEARIIFQDFETSNWTWDPVAKAYYWHRFYSHQPDLNFDNPAVQREVFKLLDYWFSLGVDGLRLDAVPYLFEREDTNCENLPETHAFLKAMRAHVNARHPDRMLLAEANQWPEDAVTYFGDDDECHMAFHFPLMPRLFMAMKMEDSFPVIDILEQTPDIPPTAQWGIFLRNHDELTLEMVTDEERDYMYRAYGRDPRHRLNLGIRRRLAPLLDNNRRGIELLNSLLCSLPGTPVIYYGDEIGMGDNVYLGDRDGVRTPMQWRPDRNAGFSGANPQRLYLPVIIDPEYHYEALNVETQQANGSSLLWWMKRLIAVRRRYQAFSRGRTTIIAGSNHRVFAFVRHTDEEAILVVVNFSRHTQVTDLSLSAYAGTVPEELFSHNELPVVRDGDYTVTIGSNDFYWLLLKPIRDASDDRHSAFPHLSISPDEWRSFPTSFGTRLEHEVLAPYLQRRHNLYPSAAKARPIQIEDRFAVSAGADRAWLTILTVARTDEEQERIALPLALARGDEAGARLKEEPAAIIADLSDEESAMVLYDGVHCPAFREHVLNVLTTKKRASGRRGVLTVQREGRTSRVAASVPSDGGLWSKVEGDTPSTTRFVFSDDRRVALFRTLESGPHPDVELTRRASRGEGFAFVPSYRAHLVYRPESGPEATVALLTHGTAHHGPASSFVAEMIDRFFDDIRSAPGYAVGAAKDGATWTPTALIHVSSRDLPEWFVEYADGFFLEMVELLGRRTGELHRRLAGTVGDTERESTASSSFQWEPFSRLYQRSLYQSMRSLLRRTIAAARKRHGSTEDETDVLIQRLFDRETAILERFRSITSRKITAGKTRVHGKYDLDHVLFTGRDFVLADLEGDPRLELSRRRLKVSPFRDVASMVGAFHRAVAERYRLAVEMRPEDETLLQPWVRPWYTAVSGLFVTAYRNEVNGSPFVPDDDDTVSALLDLFLLEQAVSEAARSVTGTGTEGDLATALDGIAAVLEREER